jgi:hypothetical protein
MSDEQKPQRSPAGNNTIHDPLHYTVRIRVSRGDDLVPETRTFSVTAYSLSEAVSQVVFEATGTTIMDVDKLSIEFIAPDEPAYWVKMLANKLMQGATSWEALRKKKEL